MATILQVVIMRANEEHWTLLPWPRSILFINLSDPIFPWSSKKHNRSKASCPDSFISFATSYSNTSIQTNKKHAACRITAGRIQGEFYKGGTRTMRSTYAHGAALSFLLYLLRPSDYLFHYLYRNCLGERQDLSVFFEFCEIEYASFLYFFFCYFYFLYPSTTIQVVMLGETFTGKTSLVVSRISHL